MGRRRNRLLAVAATAALLAAGCGASGDDEPRSADPARKGARERPVSASEVERSLAAEPAGGKGGGAIVEHENAPRQQVTCTKRSGADKAWSCRISESGGKNTLCLVEVDPRTRAVVKKSCAPVEN